ncbi:hypothetical protein NKH18_03300 [Streptomyces sp. M10(2022)]
MPLPRRRTLNTPPARAPASRMLPAASWVPWSVGAPKPAATAPAGARSLILYVSVILIRGGHLTVMVSLPAPALRNPELADEHSLPVSGQEVEGSCGPRRALAVGLLPAGSRADGDRGSR